MDTIKIVANLVQEGDFLHRVERKPRSRVFEAPVNARVVEVDTERHGDTVYVVLVLEDTTGLCITNPRITIEWDRAVWIAKGA